MLLPGFVFANYPVKNKRHSFSVCSIFRNESKYLKEWIEYHILVGVDHFYLYNNNSADNYLQILKPYIKKGIVTLVDWPDAWGNLSEENGYFWSLGTQIPAYENAIKMRSKETRWLTFLDVDEYLVPSTANTILEVLENYKDFPAIVLSSDFIDATRRNTISKQKLLIEASILTNAPKQNIFKAKEAIIFKPEFCKQSSCFPYRIEFKNEKKAIAVKKQDLRINHYLNRNKPMQFEKIKEKLYVDERIATDEEIDKLLESEIEIEEVTPAISRYYSELRKRLSL